MNISNERITKFINNNSINVLGVRIIPNANLFAGLLCEFINKPEQAVDHFIEIEAKERVNAKLKSIEMEVNDLYKRLELLDEIIKNKVDTKLGLFLARLTEHENNDVFHSKNPESAA